MRVLCAVGKGERKSRDIWIAWLIFGLALSCLTFKRWITTTHPCTGPDPMLRMLLMQKSGTDGEGRRRC